MISSRRTAAFIIANWLRDKTFPAEMLGSVRDDRAFVQDLVYTTVRRFRPLRAVLGRFVKQWPKGELEALLLVGAAQLLYMDDVADYAAVNETVNAAKACPNPAIARVVNGVLRNVLRSRDEIRKNLAAAPLGERESFPEALVRRWIARYGAENAAKLCAWHNEPGITYIARPDGSFTPLERGKSVRDVQGFDSGAFIAQDPATKQAVSLCPVVPGVRVLDFCAAPGGKSIQLAWRGADVTAHEVNPKRLKRLSQNIARCALANVHAVCSISPEENFDCVLVDAPCTNTGVLRRRPDARWRWSEAHLAEIVKLQGEILEKAAVHCAPGGTLVYSTCSNEPEENGEQVAQFLRAHPDFEEVARCESIPFETNTDGAFACALKRKSV